MRALVGGAGGFIGGHLVERLKAEGYWVRGVDLKEPEFRPTAADVFVVADLRDPASCDQAVLVEGQPVDEVYQLAADMGGMGFIHSSETECLRNNALINMNVVHAAAEAGVPRYFYSSSVCIYRDVDPSEPTLTEADAYPPAPDNEYGWEKLYSERVVAAYGRRYPMATRIARFENCYGPYGTWTGGREKAPAAICRKVAEAGDGGIVEVWGDGTAIRTFVYVEDLVDAVYRLMHSDLTEPANIGNEELVSIKELADLVADVAGKKIDIRYVDGPVGVRGRNFSHERIRSLGWEPRHSLEDGIRKTYPWIAAQVEAAR